MKTTTPTQLFNFTIIGDATGGCEFDYTITAEVTLPDGQTRSFSHTFHYYNQTSFRDEEGGLPKYMPITTETVDEIMKSLLDYDVGNLGYVISPDDPYTVSSYAISFDTKNDGVVDYQAELTPGSTDVISVMLDGPMHFHATATLSGSVSKADGLKMIIPDVSGYVTPRNAWGRAYGLTEGVTYTIDDNNNEVNELVTLTISGKMIFGRTDYIENEIVLSYLDDRGMIAEAPAGQLVITSSSELITIDNNRVIAKAPGTAVINVKVGDAETQVTLTIT